MQDFDLLIEPFELADLRIVARQHAFGAGELDEQRRERRAKAIHALRQRLHDEIVVIAIDDQRRQQIRLAVHQPVRRGVDLQRRAERDRAIEAAAPECLVDRR